MLSEERFHLFKTSYGIDEAAIDFSTFKFRHAALSVKGRVLCWRIIQQVIVMRIKQSILNRSDFKDFIRTKTRNIYAPTQLNYVIVSLYGIPMASNMLGTIKSEKLLKLDNLTQSDNFSKVKIEITLQTEFESISIEDTKDYSLLLRRNNKSVDNLSRDLKNTVKGFKIIQEDREAYTLSTKEMDNLGANALMNDSKSDLESWNGSIDSFDSNSDRQSRDARLEAQKVVLHPSELLKTGYPEIQKKILEQNEKETILYIINKKTYEVSIYFISAVERTRKDLIKYIDKQRTADWEFIYIEVISRVTKEYFRLILKESQIVTMLGWAEATKNIMRKEQRTSLAKLICKWLEIKSVGEYNRDDTNEQLEVSNSFKPKNVVNMLK